MSVVQPLPQLPLLGEGAIGAAWSSQETEEDYFRVPGTKPPETIKLGSLKGQLGTSDPWSNTSLPLVTLGAENGQNTDARY